MRAGRDHAARPRAQTAPSLQTSPSRAPARSEGGTAPSHALSKVRLGVGGVIQRVAIDRHGALLKHPSPSTLDASQRARLDAMQKDKSGSHVFEDQAAFEDHVETGKTPYHSLALKPGAYKAKLPAAIARARKRRDLAPLKARTQKGGVLVADVPEFNDLTEHQIPFFPQGNYVYWSEKRAAWKRRKDAAASDAWRLALYQEGPTRPVAYNMAHEDRLVRTLFQHDEGKKRGPRRMAGLEGKGATPKWQAADVVTVTGKKRKLNQDPTPTTLVQGHGQDYERTMRWVGDYDATHSHAASLTLPPGEIQHADQHPMNFSTEYAPYGKNVRNVVLKRARKDDAEGSIVEDTEYHDAKLAVPVPAGFGDVHLPREKALTTLDRSGRPIKRYRLRQLDENPHKKGRFTTPDYAALAEKHSGKPQGKANMDDLLAAAKVDEKPVLNPSYVSGATGPPVNAWTPQAGDDAQTRKKLERRKSFFHLKEKDF